MIYKLYQTIGSNVANAAMTLGVEPQISFLFDPNNSSYVNFKQQINDQTAQLEDVDGVLMSADEAIAYVATLP